MWLVYVLGFVVDVVLKQGQANDYQNAIDLVRTSGARVVHPVFITPPEDWLVEGGTNVDDLMDNILRSQARAGCEYYLGTLEDCNVKTMSDIIAFNKANAEKEFDDGNTPFHWILGY
jgi:amidase